VGADDDELGVLGLLDECPDRAIARDEPLHLDIGVPVRESRQPLRQRLELLLFEFLPVILCEGSIQVCTATRGADRAEASANAHSVALALTSEPSIPTTTGPLRFRSSVSSRVTTTGQNAWLATAADTEPSTMPLIPPRPREPRTMSLALRE
jgi:hypothetical protein